MMNPKQDISSTEFDRPPRMKNNKGATRKVGIEVEFGADDIRNVSEVVAEQFGGRVERINPHRYKIHDTPLGTFTAELDTQYVHSDSVPDIFSQPIEQWVDHELKRYFNELLGDISKTVVPYEIVTPPISIDRLHEVEPLLTTLHSIGARGTDENALYAFGMHLNPEVPSLEAHSILNYLRAFILLSSWLHEQMQIDWARKWSPYIDPFPEDYSRLILNSAYRPNQAELIRDYVKYNPTRNRELDLIPLFMFIDEAYVKEKMEDDLSSARPTFHYRLPDSRLNDPQWSLARQWNYWVQVEQLAETPELLETISASYIENLDQPILKKWSDRVGDGLKGFNFKE